ncbi:MAG: hypothetical protein MPN21_17835 [Thermoanaerobaculia bacterium]|nr:hypothetical protein [Thermoanaerobaculia bacterium]
MSSELYVERLPIEVEEGYLGYFKYEGKLVQDGYLAATQSAQALLGMDKALRHFFVALEPGLEEVEFDIPVRVRAGSWEALIPETLEQWVAAGAGAAFTTYLVTVAKRAAENDVGERGLGDIARTALHGVQWFIRVGRHLGKVEMRRLEEVKIDAENLLIGIPNDDGETLWLPKFHFDLLQAAPRTLLKELVAVVEKERALVVGVVEENELTEVRADHDVRSVFVEEDQEEDDVLFPELEHGMKVDLEGRVTRGNGESNTIGFKYNGHILTCLPEAGRVTRFKPVMFSPARIVGVITREKTQFDFGAARPKIIFSELTRIERKADQRELFP